MESLKIAATNNTPEINFDFNKATLLISGRCFTQNILEFYAPVKKWVEDSARINHTRPQDRIHEFRFYRYHCQSP